jgi:hypothetical protein
MSYKTLHLTLKKKWYDMIASGEKKEEYRELSFYWIKRLIDINYPFESKDELHNIPYDIKYDLRNGHDPIVVLSSYYSSFRSFDDIHFYNGGSAWVKYPNFKIEFKGFEIREGKPEWGAEPGKKYFVMKLGGVIKNS